MADASTYNPGTQDDDGSGFSAPQVAPVDVFTPPHAETFYVPPVRQQAGVTIPWGNNPPTRYVKKPTEGRGFYPGLDGASSVGSIIPPGMRGGRLGTRRGR